MIFLLDIFLLFNLLWAYNFFKSLVAPPVLFGFGMVLASIIASNYYEEWGLNNLLLETFFIFAFSPILFTLVCVCLQQKGIVCRGGCGILIDFYSNRSVILLLFTITLGVFGIVFLYKFYVNTFGSHLNVSGLLFQARLHLMSGELQLPLIIKLSDMANGFVSYFSSWGISLYLITHKKKDKLFFLMALQLIVTSILGLGSGSKGEFAEPITRLAIILLFLRYTYSPPRLSQKSIVKIISITTFSFLCFIQINTFIGRGTDEYKSGLDLVAEYCGAQIKNFDIYLNNKEALKYADSGRIGEQTFLSLYNDLGIDKIKYAGNFEHYQKYRLGNVYSTYLPFYKDFGLAGVFTMVVIISLLSMYLFNRSILINRKNFMPNVCFFVYSSIAFPLFMSFFSSRFTERFFRIGMLRNIILFWIGIYLFKKFIIKKQDIIES